MNEDIKVTFIIPKECRDENDCSEEMQLAFIACQQHSGGGLQADWVNEDAYDDFEGLTKKDVLVLTEFSGELYDKLRATKCLLVGPRCLSCCLTEGVPIPSGPEPVFTVAMRGLVITASGLSKQKKEEIKRKIHWMGGIYSNVLTDENTHLVSDTILSDKYIKSVEKGLPVMCETWIDAVWESSLRLNINAASPDFNDHILPPFANLQVTTSGISKKDKQKIMKLINENGGVFTGAFQSETTDVVIMTKEGVGSEKYKAAVEYGKPCVVSQWVEESARRGVALPLREFRVPAACSSSPLAGHSRLPDLSKYKAAVEYGKPCVVPQWVEKSARRGVALPLREFRVPAACSSSPLAGHSCLPDLSKYKAAVEYGKPCVVPQWVEESARRGVALPLREFRVPAACSSSPLAGHSRLSDLSKYKAAVEYGKPCVVPQWVEKSARRGVALPLREFRVPAACSSSPLAGHSRLSDLSKYKAAVEYGKPCVVPQWVEESARRGVALPLRKFRVPAACSSSPLAGHSRLPDLSKYKAAVEYGKPCVVPQWVEESARRGVALPLREFRVPAACSSSPLAGHSRLPDLSKYKAAVEYGKPCVVPQWVEESARRGVALPLRKFRVPAACSSSPLAGHSRLPDLSKYKAAVEYGKPCVVPQWVEESARRGVALPLREFRVPAACSSSPLAGHSRLSDLSKYKAAVEYGKPCVVPQWVEESARRGVALPLREFRVPAACSSSPLAGHSRLPDLSKYKAAVEYGKPCVVPQWVEESARRGVALPLRKFRVPAACSSSPLAGHSRLPDLSKYKAAVEYGKPCVVPQWVEESARRGVALPLRKFRVPAACSSSPLAGHSRLPDLSKYKAAVEYGKPCVVPQWVEESARRGVALPLRKFRVPAACSSSPLAGHSRLPDLSLNFSRITSSRPPNNFVEESRLTDMSTVSAKMRLSQDIKKTEVSVDKETIEAFENFDMSLIKKAGSIFDGFCIYVVGVGAAACRAWSLVSRCGGVRYEAPHARVTHAVCGTRAAATTAASQVPGVPLLSPKWLLDSVTAGVALPEIDYLIESEPRTPAKSCRARPEAASPMSRRNLQLLLDPPAPSPAPAPGPPPQDHDPQDDIVNHYLSQKQEDVAPPDERRVEVSVAPDHRQQNITEDVTCMEQPTEDLEIFKDVIIEVAGLEAEAVREVGAEVRAAGGELRRAGGGGSYVLVPLDYDVADLPDTRPEPVTVFWIKDCLSQGSLVELQYYHRPVRLEPWIGSAPLTGVVASLSTYSGVERAFLDELAKLLGATTQLRFCRRSAGTSLACTHLICPTAGGDKYRGAARWGLPAVTAAWLLHCAAAGRRLPEDRYLVSEPGDTSAAPEPAASKTEQQADIRGVEHTNKENEMLPPQLPPPKLPPTTEQTPTGKTAFASDVGELSPASRYIAMARQGLLPGDSQHTPQNAADKDQNQPAEAGVCTPPLLEALATPNLRGLSPTTRRRLLAVRRGDPPSDPIRTPRDPGRCIRTPESSFGAALGAGGTLSPDARKRLWATVDSLPAAPPQTSNHNTPLSEIRNRFLAQFNAEASTPTADHQPHPRKLLLQDQSETPPPAKTAKFFQDQSANSKLNFNESKSDGKNTTHIPDLANGSSTASEIDPCNKSSKACSPVRVSAAVEEQLQRLNAALTGRSSASKLKRSRDSVSTIQPVVEPEPGPVSQPNTVGWDDTAPAPVTTPDVTQPAVKYFMLSSNVDNREEVEAMITNLGGVVCAGAELDARATHLVCALPGRSEKMLASVAAGRRVLHPLYVLRSHRSGGWLPEDEYEWGNPAATELPKLSPSEQILADAAYRWRVRREGGGAGAFHNVVALLHVAPPRRDLLARLLRAGGGEALPHTAPYSDPSATLCLAEPRRAALSAQQTQQLRARRLPVCAPVLLSSLLTDDPPPDPALHCLPDFQL